ncbi:zinc ABC transporter substrate-binding protein [Moraxella caviae]|uniref:High-affinity zinc uptake system protein ZnuA n=1 Tax=Moraxella caviae TaxID=34060 RepID=A0A1T0A0I3_9GAMM|nr:zinc ABC transporter substrate-binding protein [Moraxella caviae]OOR89256.1 zinc ABC transporter substrate-binding protein [Moraxella caviae]STZ13867.1 High-affinity zinc uptake system protein znuA precursor [Moraxella caviae]VEW11175.1 High-affinity zinc uptake system protein znuA precursor [Moraxella caviae]
MKISSLIGFVKNKFVFKILSALLAAALGSTLHLAHAGTVSVSNYPLALLSNAVTKGVADAEVLLGTGDVGHHGELSPSGVKQVQDSDFVVWFGASLEQNLVNALSSAPNAIALLEFDAFERLPLRYVDGRAQADSLDTHLWLEPENAKAIVRALAVIHSYANPQNAVQYAKNAAEFERRMDRAVASVNRTKILPYWAYHDAYQYLERAAGLKFQGALTPDHHLAPKASQLKFLGDNRPQSVMCLAAQGKVSNGIRSKLGKLNVVVRQEDMSDGDEFIATWQALVSDLRACASGKLLD